MADWSKITSRGDVQDRRSFSSVAGATGGIGVVGIIIYLAVNFLSGNSASSTLGGLLGQLQNTQTQQQALDPSVFSGNGDYKTFAATVLGSTTDTWTEIFKQTGKTYKPPELVLFRSATQSGCGVATSDVGPFYCPNDQTIYLDETFFDELQSRFHAKAGDVAQAYVIAHEVGHNVQKQLGIMDGSEYQATIKQGGENHASIDLELQADCFAGVWGNAVQKEGVIASTEFSQATNAAAAVGDDRIQKDVGQQVNQESWTHGSADQRTKWLSAGFASGKPASCDTFAN